jgi:hypothetical protein
MGLGGKPQQTGIVRRGRFPRLTYLAVACPSLSWAPISQRAESSGSGKPVAQSDGGEVHTERTDRAARETGRATQLLLQGGADIISLVVAALAGVCRRVDCDAKEIARRLQADNRMFVPVSQTPKLERLRGDRDPFLGAIGFLYVTGRQRAPNLRSPVRKPNEPTQHRDLSRLRPTDQNDNFSGICAITSRVSRSLSGQLSGQA